MDRIKVPADVDLEDRLAFGLTFRQLLILVVAAIGAYLIFSVVGTVAPLPFAAAAATPVALIGVGLAFGRLDGLPGDRLALAALRLLLGPRRRVLAPEGVSAPLPGADAVRQPASSPLDVPVRAIFRSGVVELRDGRFCLLATAGGTSFGLRGDEEQVGLVEAYGRWLHSLTEPAGITVRSEPVDLAGKAADLRDGADELPHPRSLARRALTPTSFKSLATTAGCAADRSSSRYDEREGPRRGDGDAATQRRGGPRAAARGRRRPATAGRRGDRRAARARDRTARPPDRFLPHGGRHMLSNLLPTRRAAGGSLAGPASLELERDCVRVGERWQRTFAVIGYPREVTRGWLAPLLRAAGDLDSTLHVDPVPPQVASSNLQRQRARLESSRRIEADRGQLADPTIAAAAEDADELASRLARGESRLFRNALYLSITAPDRDELEARSERVRSLCASLMLHAVPATFRPLDGWLSSLPLGMDRLRMRRAWDTEALAAAFPWASIDPPVETDGVLYGVTDSGAPVIADRFARENYNTVVLAAARARARASWRRSRRCGCSIAACRSGSSTPRRSTGRCARRSAAPTCR